ncbi:MAG: alpha/beta hydrolase [Propionibacteriales bacterium]|nr:alpha/beta hydrolase [Propionibacteriales bacterium]
MVGLILDARAYLMQKSAPLTVRYGEAHRYSGSDLAPPRSIRVPTRHGRVRCDVYQPADRGTSLPAYVHFHGGAFVMRYPAMDDFFARIVAAELGAVVINVDYDVAPQKRFPVAQEQCHDVSAWVATNPEELGIDPLRVALGGFSAGGNLAASAALQARDLGSFTPVCQLLGVPSLDVAEPTTAKHAAIPHPMLTAGLLDLVRATYFRDVAARSSPYASPLRAASLAGLPPAIVVTAEYDLLRAEGDRYADRMRTEGVEVLHHVVRGADHYFLEAGPAGARSTLNLIVEGLGAHLEQRNSR